ncbi:hypothetical protein F4802DRAFT_616747 [Xylaria palmicola]|nr:hypothetical protein F4802DRAFT_616747 [Xylaria palmicola]
MAELPAQPFNKHSEEPMTTKVKSTQPQSADATYPSEGDNNTSLHGTCMAESATHGADSLAGGDLPTFEGSDIDGPGSDATAAEGVVEDAGGDVGMEVQVKKKKKKKRTPKSRRNITGFEEYYADAPTTPAEACENRKLYDPTRSFPDRIEECLQRFRARRRMDSQRKAMFDKYLFLGGIDASPRQFTGVTGDRDAMEEADAEEIRTMTAVDFVGGSGGRFYDNSKSQEWEVDFEAIAKGFFSRTLTDWYMYDEVAIKIAADLVRNFLNYVLMHDVCPEYTDDVMAARNICDIAPAELRYMNELILGLPGVFNSAARSLFCDGKVSHLDKDENYDALVQFRLTALLWSLSEKTKQCKEKILQAEDPTTIKVVSTREGTYQVLAVERPRRKDKKVVDEQLTAMKLAVKLKPAGLIRVVPSIIEHGWGNMPRPEEVDFRDTEKEEFVLEDELLASVEVGMKMHLTVCELNIGLSFIKEVHDVRVSFDTFLPQYLMTNWKEPVPNERPPPSIHNPDSVEKAMSAAMQCD